MFAGLTTPLSCRGQGPLVSLKQRSVRLAALAWHIAGDTGRLQAVCVPGVCRIKSWIMDRWVGDSTSCDARLDKKVFFFFFFKVSTCKLYLKHVVIILVRQSSCYVQDLLGMVALIQPHWLTGGRKTLIYLLNVYLLARRGLP